MKAFTEHLGLLLLLLVILMDPSSADELPRKIRNGPPEEFISTRGHDDLEKVKWTALRHFSVDHHTSTEIAVGGSNMRYIMSESYLDIYGHSNESEVRHEDRGVGQVKSWEYDGDKEVKLHVRKIKQHDRDDLPAHVLVATNEPTTVEVGFIKTSFLQGQGMTIEGCVHHPDDGTPQISHECTVATLSIDSGSAKSLHQIKFPHTNCFQVNTTAHVAGQYDFVIDVCGTLSSRGASKSFFNSAFASVEVVEPFGQAKDFSMRNGEDRDYIYIDVRGQGAPPGTTHYMRVKGMLQGQKDGGDLVDIVHAKHVVKVAVDEGGAWTTTIEFHAGWCSDMDFSARDQYRIRDFALVYLEKTRIEGTYTATAKVTQHQDLREFPSAAEFRDANPNQHSRHKEMRQGKVPERYRSRRGTQARKLLQEETRRGVLLVHGYCACNCPFELDHFDEEKTIFFQLEGEGCNSKCVGENSLKKQDKCVECDKNPCGDSAVQVCEINQRGREECECTTLKGKPCKKTNGVWTGYTDKNGVTQQYFNLNGGHNWNNFMFAKRIGKFLNQSGLDSCAIIAHSQGGLGSTELVESFFSCLDYEDKIRGSKRIQSVGSPYQGTKLAGVPAKLAATFNVGGCDTNGDLTHSGARKWLQDISIETQQQVYYTTTSIGNKGKLKEKNRFCSVVTAPILGKWKWKKVGGIKLPIRVYEYHEQNDGVVEKSRGQLPHGNNEGHKKGECHREGMEEKSQAHNKDRNKKMAEEALI